MRSTVMLLGSARQSNASARASGAMPDNQHVADLRDRLKLAALAYDQARRGADDLTMTSTMNLCGAAVYYYNALMRLSGQASYVEDRTLGLGDLPPPDASLEDAKIVQARVALKLAAIAYASGRHGVDACVEFNRAAVAGLCTAAIHYREALSGAGRAGPRDDEALDVSEA